MPGEVHILTRNNDKDLKFKVGDHVRVSKIFGKDYAPNWWQEVAKDESNRV